MKNLHFQRVRGICILAVIFIHCLVIPNSSTYFALNIIIRKIIDFAVPVFIFLSGLFVNIINNKEFYKKKFIRLFPSLIIWDIIYLFIYMMTNDIDLPSLIKLFILSNSTPHLYYIYVLIQLFLITPLLNKYILKTKNNIKIFIPLLITPLSNLIILLLWIIFKFDIPYYQYLIFGWFSYYYLGILIKEREIKYKYKYINFIILLICSFVEGLIINFIFDNYSLAVSQLSFFNSLLCVLLCIKIYDNANVSDENVNFITKLGDYSFGIYLSHILFLKLIRKFIGYIGISNYYINVVLIFIFTVTICYIFNSIYYKNKKKFNLFRLKDKR